jgi:hypothetical protein
MIRGVVIAALAVVLAWVRWHGMPWVALRALNSAEQYELLSLQPLLSQPDFYGHEILGRVLIKDVATRKKLTSALQWGARQSDGTRMACFNPRHGIRVTRGGVVTDFVICFECRQVEVWRGGKRLASFLTSDWPQPVFDDVLKRAGVPLAPKER